MITIVTGKKNAGKTTYLKNLFEKTKKGDGFLSIKYFENNKHLGFDLLHLQTGNIKPFIRREEHLPKNWEEIFKICSYSISKDGFEYANQIIENAKEEPLYIDEIGPLEIFQNQCFHKLLKNNLNRELYITVRESQYDDLFETFNITQEINKIEIE